MTKRVALLYLAFCAHRRDGGHGACTTIGFAIPRSANYLLEKAAFFLAARWHLPIPEKVKIPLCYDDSNVKHRVMFPMDSLKVIEYYHPSQIAPFSLDCSFLILLAHVHSRIRGLFTNFQPFSPGN